MTFNRGSLTFLGVELHERFEDMTRPNWGRIDINLDGTFNRMNAFFDDNWAVEHGRLRNVSSVVGQQDNYGQANYATSMWGYSGTPNASARIVQHRIDRELRRPGSRRPICWRSSPIGYAGKFIRRLSLNRFAEPEDVADVVRFFGSDESSYMTGKSSASTVVQKAGHGFIHLTVQLHPMNTDRSSGISTTDSVEIPVIMVAYRPRTSANSATATTARRAAR